ncbi:MAG: hypothetical protein R2911_06235 [Caldilineaceae bacterium]
MNATFSISSYLFRFFTSVTPTASVDQAAQRAYARVMDNYGRPNSTLFTWRFLQEEGADIVNDYISGKVTRHRAAETLAQAWNTDLGNISAQQRRFRMASTAMNADFFFTELAKELNAH